MGEDVEILAIGTIVIDGAGRRAPISELEKSVAGLRIVPLDERNHFKAREVRFEMPRNVVAEIVLPDVENPAHRCVHRRGGELPRSRYQVIVVSIRPGLHGDVRLSGKWRTGELRIRQLVDRIDDEHARVGGAGPHLIRRNRHHDGFGCDIRIDIVRERQDEKPRSRLLYLQIELEGHGLLLA